MPREFSSRFVACKLTLAASLLLHAPGALAESARLEFNRDIRPILSDKCFACHGFDANERKADLRLDIPEGAYALNDDIQAIKPGDLQSSEVWRRITSTDEDEVMPPPESNKHLTDVEKDLLKRWIEKGAQYQLHWAFVPPKKSAKSLRRHTPRVACHADARDAVALRSACGSRAAWVEAHRIQGIRG